MANKNICDVPLLQELTDLENVIVDSYGTLRKMNLKKEFDKVEEEISEFKTKMAQECAGAIVASSTGTVIPLSDSAEQRLKRLLLRGKSTQDGTPTPSAQVDIVSAGKYNEATGKYEIKTYFTGKNLFDTEKYLEIAFGVNLGCEVVEFDGRRCLHIPTKIHAPKETIFDRFLSNTQYTIGFDVYTVSYETNNCSGNGFAFKYTDDSMQWILPTSTYYAIEKWYHLKGVSMSGKSIASFFPTNGSYCETYIDLDSIQLEMGTTESGYEPHRPVQTVTITSDYPITKWDKLDMRNGVYGWSYKGLKLTVDGSGTWETYNGDYAGFIKYSALPENMDRRDGYCNQLRIDVMGGIMQNGLWIGVNNNKLLYMINNDYYDSSLDDKGLANWKAHLNENPLIIWTYVDTETWVPLSQTEQDALNALTAYYPNTTITNDQGVTMEVDYVADTKNYIDNLKTQHEADIQTLKTAIIALGGSV